MNAQVKSKLIELFKQEEDNLYLSYEELHHKYPTVPPSVWETFLDQNDIQQFVQKRIAKLSEIHARKALKTLTKGEFAPQEVAALKSIIESSTLLQKKANQHEHIFVSFVPVPDYANQTNQTKGETHENQTSPSIT